MAQIKVVGVESWCASIVGLFGPEETLARGLLETRNIVARHWSLFNWDIEDDSGASAWPSVQMRCLGRGMRQCHGHQGIVVLSDTSWAPPAAQTRRPSPSGGRSAADQFGCVASKYQTAVLWSACRRIPVGSACARPAYVAYSRRTHYETRFRPAFASYGHRHRHLTSRGPSSNLASRIRPSLKFVLAETRTRQ
jgi:hypothetical protein